MARDPERVTDAARRHAVRQVKDAATAGRIIEADRDLRLRQVFDARSTSELDLILRGLPSDGAPYVPYVPPPAPRGSNVRPALVAAVVLGPLVLGVLVGLSDTSTSTSTGTSGARSIELAEPRYVPNVLTGRGFRDLVTAVRDETGDTLVFSATLYATRATVDVPVAQTGRERRTLLYDGTLVDQDLTGTSRTRRVDLAGIRPGAIPQLVKQVSALVDDPTQVSVAIAAPNALEPGVYLTATAISADGDEAYLAAGRSGQVIRTSQS